MPHSPSEAQITRHHLHEAIRTLIRHIGDDPSREGLLATPERVLKAWSQDWGRGYHAADPRELMRLFDSLPNETPFIMEDWHPAYNEMVIVRDINLYSTCEHHLAPFFGEAHIGYVPVRRGIIGLSKLARIVDHFSRRLQTQEHLTVQIADCLAEHLSPHIGVILSCHHTCMSSRGVMQPNARTITTALKGNLYELPEARSEFLQACRAKA